MLDCIYTTQKNKKLKKWIDGFVMRSGRGLVLYDEEKKVLCRAGKFTTREDGNVEASIYLIYSEGFILSEGKLSEANLFDCEANLSKEINLTGEANLSREINSTGEVSLSREMNSTGEANLFNCEANLSGEAKLDLPRLTDCEDTANSKVNKGRSADDICSLLINK